MALEGFKILGVDPGTNMTGYSIIEGHGNEVRLVTAGIFDLRHYDDHQTKLKEIFLQLQEIIETYLPRHLAIEAPFYGKNVQSMLKLGRAQGVAMAAAMTMGLEIHEYAPKKIKMAVTGSGQASKEQVAAMLESRLNIRLASKYLDASDALACAVCHLQRLGPHGTTTPITKHKDWKSYIKANQARTNIK